MIALDVMMGSKRGRPRSDGNKIAVKLNGDLVQMMRWIVRLRKQQGFTLADLCDPLLRGPIEIEYAKIEPQVEKIKREEMKGADQLAEE